MSESAEKATRRDLRRVVGAQALEVVDANSAALNNRVFPSLVLLQQQVRVLDDRLTALEWRYDDSERVAADTFSRLSAFVYRPFWQRLAWLVMGS